MKNAPHSFVAVLFALNVVACAPAPAEGEGEGEGEGEVAALVVVDATGGKDVTTDGSVALVERIGFGDVLIVDTTDGSTIEQTTMPDVFRNQSGGLSDTLDVVADYELPVQAARFHDGVWTTLDSLFATGCADGDGLVTDVAGAFDISSAGDVVVGHAYDGCVPKAMRWDDDENGGTMTALAAVGDGSSRASVVSDDGRVAGGFATLAPLDRRAALWSDDGTGFLLAPDDRDNPSEILALNVDGSVAVGVRSNEAFRYTAETGMVNLGRLEGSLPGLDNVFANALTADGDVVFGICGFDAYVWTEAAGMRKLADVIAAEAGLVDDRFVLNNVLAASHDGSVLVVTATRIADNGGITVFVRVPSSTWR